MQLLLGLRIAAEHRGRQERGADNRGSAARPQVQHAFFLGDPDDAVDAVLVVPAQFWGHLSLRRHAHQGHLARSDRIRSRV